MEPCGCHGPCTDRASVHETRPGGHVPRWSVGIGTCAGSGGASSTVSHACRRVVVMRAAGLRGWASVGVAHCSRRSRSFVLAALRALHLDRCCAAGRCGGHPPLRGAARAPWTIVGRLMRRRRGTAFSHDVSPHRVDPLDRGQPARDVARDGPETPPARRAASPKAKGCNHSHRCTPVRGARGRPRRDMGTVSDPRFEGRSPQRSSGRSSQCAQVSRMTRCGVSAADKRDDGR
jgi:hypothetical protein